MNSNLRLRPAQPKGPVLSTAEGPVLSIAEGPVMDEDEEADEDEANSLKQILLAVFSIRVF